MDILGILDPDSHNNRCGSATLQKLKVSLMVVKCQQSQGCKIINEIFFFLQIVNYIFCAKSVFQLTKCQKQQEPTQNLGSGVYNSGFLFQCVLFIFLVQEFTAELEADFATLGRGFTSYPGLGEVSSNRLIIERLVKIPK